MSQALDCIRLYAKSNEPKMGKNSKRTYIFVVWYFFSFFNLSVVWLPTHFIPLSFCINQAKRNRNRNKHKHIQKENCEIMIIGLFWALFLSAKSNNLSSFTILPLLRLFSHIGWMKCGWNIRNEETTKWYITCVMSMCKGIYSNRLYCKKNNKNKFTLHNHQTKLYILLWCTISSRALPKSPKNSKYERKHFWVCFCAHLYVFFTIMFYVSSFHSFFLSKFSSIDFNQ